MNEAEIEELKTKIKKVMVDHLTPLGFPDLEHAVIMGEIKNMWVKIEDAGLKVPGMTLQAFAQHAEQQFMLAQMKDMLGL